MYHQSTGALGLLLCQILHACLAQDFPWATEIPSSGWRITSDSSQPDNGPFKALDNISATFWQSKSSTSFPHYLEVDTKQHLVVTGLSYQPRQNASDAGNIAQHTITLSLDGTSWTPPVAFGTFLNDNTTKYTFFTPQAARYLRFTALSEAGGGTFVNVAELSIYAPIPAIIPSTAPVSSKGHWGVTIDFPLVPAGGFLTVDGTVVVYSAFRPDDNWDVTIDTGGSGQTYASTWTVGSSTVSERIVSNTHRKLFPP